MESSLQLQCGDVLRREPEGAKMPSRLMGKREWTREGVGSQDGEDEDGKSRQILELHREPGK